MYPVSLTCSHFPLKQAFWQIGGFTGHQGIYRAVVSILIHLWLSNQGVKVNKIEKRKGRRSKRKKIKEEQRKKIKEEEGQGREKEEDKR